MKNGYRAKRWIRAGLLGLALTAFIGACTSPTNPRVPGDDGGEEPNEPDGQGMVVDGGYAGGQGLILP